MNKRLIVLAKAPRRGLVKTRLAAELGDTGALAAYRVLIGQLLDHLAELPQVEIHVAPADATDEIQAWLRPGWRARPQPTGDLGTRIEHAFALAFADGAQSVAVIGSDCPDVTVNDIGEAWSALDQTDLVLGPSEDGGYWLVGARAVHPALFRDMPWSTPTVLAETLLRADSLRLRIRLLRRLADIDTAADWERHQRQINDVSR